MQKEHSTKHIVRVRKRGRSRFCLQRINKTNDRPAIETKIDNITYQLRRKRKRKHILENVWFEREGRGKKKKKKNIPSKHIEVFEKHLEEIAGPRSHYWSLEWMLVLVLVFVFEPLRASRGERERESAWFACERTKADRCEKKKERW